MREGLKSTSTKLFSAFRSEPAAGRTIRIKRSSKTDSGNASW
jgi:hypothetical protein